MAHFNTREMFFSHIGHTELFIDQALHGYEPPVETPTVYGWHVDPSISDPAQAVTYLADAVGKTPAAMGASTFSYGDWANAFFMPRPCMLRSDGTVAYYLNPNDYTQKLGTAAGKTSAAVPIVQGNVYWNNVTAGEEPTYNSANIRCRMSAPQAIPPHTSIEIILNRSDVRMSCSITDSRGYYVQRKTSGWASSTTYKNTTDTTKYILGSFAFSDPTLPITPSDFTVTMTSEPLNTDIANSSFDGNAMMEWPLIWYKFESLEDKGYRAVEYLKSTGTQIILTDIIGRNDYTYRADIQVTDTTQVDPAYRSIWGSLEFESGAVVARVGNNFGSSFSAHTLVYYMGTNEFFSIVYPSTMATTRNIIVAGRPQSSYGSVNKSYTLPVTFRDPAIPIAIFGDLRKEDDGEPYLSPYQITKELCLYSFKIFNSEGDLIYDLIPVERTSDNELGLYDVVTNKFYGNAGTGTFEKGDYVDGHGFFYCSPVKVDSSYECWCNYDANNNIIPHFYTAVYNGTGISKMRSLSGYTLTNDNGMGTVSLTDELTRARANNTTEADEWYIDVWSDRQLISALLVLMGKSLDVQSVFGKGQVGGGETAQNNVTTGDLDDKGLFYGSTTDDRMSVKVFGMENWWGTTARMTAGLIGAYDGYLYKLTYGTADGTTANGYNNTGSGYKRKQMTRPSVQGGVITKMLFGEFGYLPMAAVEGTDNVYYTDRYISGNYYLIASDCHYSTAVGTFGMRFDIRPHEGFWLYGAALSCKPVGR